MAKITKGGKRKKAAKPANRRVPQKVTKKPRKSGKAVKAKKAVKPVLPAQRLSPSRVRPRRRPSMTVSQWPATKSAYDQLPRTPANFQPLTPLSMLERAASVFPDHVAVIHGSQRFSYTEFYRRSRQLASALAKHGIGKNDTVAVMLANTPAMLEAHYGVPMAGGVLNALNTRLDAPAITYMLEHGGANILITDREFSATIAEALKSLKHK